MAGYDIPGGMIYLGSGLSAASLWGPGVEPALIDPRRPVNKGSPDLAGELMAYWPGYSTIPPASRAGYLEWLAGGRQDPSVGIGHVFLFFYGLERRLLLDATFLETARNERNSLFAEIERLLSVYGQHNSFRGYATQLLELARLAAKPFTLEDLVPPTARTGWQVPLSVRLALGILTQQGQPIPATWALAWARSAPEIRLRTPAHRCSREFEELFTIRYEAAFRDGGLRLKPNKTRLSAQYQPASASFRQAVTLELPNLPDVAMLTAPQRKLQEVVDRVCQELDPFSRYVGRTSEIDTVGALSLLPAELATRRESPATRSLLDWLEYLVAGQDLALISTDELLSRWPSTIKPSRRDIEQLCQFLASRGFGIEPDLRFGAPSLTQSKNVALFRVPIGADGPVADETLRSARLFLELGVAVAVADGTLRAGEEWLLEQRLEVHGGLSEAGRIRLRALMRWLIHEQPAFIGLKNRVSALPEARRGHLAGLLLATATADGSISSEEVKLLERVYPWLGLPRDQVYADLHSLAARVPAATEPVTVRRADRRARERPLPLPPSSVALDPDLVARLRDESAEALSLLSSIFTSDEEQASPQISSPQAADTGGAVLPGLDAAHSALLRRLAERDSWDGAEVERLAGELGLLPDGALEVINEAALEHWGEPVLEGDETVHVDRARLEVAGA